MKATAGLGTRVVQHQLPNGNLLVEGDPTFRCYWGNTDTINAIDHYIVTEMKKFPEGTFKMALVRGKASGKDS